MSSNNGLGLIQCGQRRASAGRSARDDRELAERWIVELRLGNRQIPVAATGDEYAAGRKQARAMTRPRFVQRSGGSKRLSARIIDLGRIETAPTRATSHE